MERHERGNWQGRGALGKLSDKGNLLILSLSVLSFGLIILLAALGEKRITVYLPAIALAYFADTLIIRAKRRTRFDFLGAALFVVFVLSIVATVI